MGQFALARGPNRAHWPQGAVRPWDHVRLGPWAHEHESMRPWAMGPYPVTETSTSLRFPLSKFPLISSWTRASSDAFHGKALRAMAQTLQAKKKSAKIMIAKIATVSTTPKNLNIILKCIPALQANLTKHRASLGQASPDQTANVMHVRHRPTVRHCPTAIKQASSIPGSGIARPLCISSQASPDQCKLELHIFNHNSQ